MQDDVQLLRQFVDARSEPAFAELVRRHVNLVYSVASRQVGGDLSLAQDVTQQVFTTLAAKAGQLLDRPTLGGWLYRTTQFQASVTVRSERRRRAHEQEAAMNIERGGGEHIDWDKARPLLDEAIAELGEQDRDGIFLRFFENRPFAEVGAKLGLTDHAARMRVERALDKLHAHLSRRGVTSTAAAVGVALATQASGAAPLGLAATISNTVLAASISLPGASTAAVAGIFMNKATLIASAVAALAISLAVYELDSANYATRLATNYRQENDALRKRLAASQAKAAGEGSVAAVALPFQSGVPARATAASKPATPSASNPSPESRFSPAGQSPRKSVRADRNGKSVPVLLEGYLNNLYIGLYQRLQFSPEQIARFKELVRQNNKRHEELDGIAAAQGIKVTDPDMEDFYVEADTELQSKIIAAFGEDASKQIKLFTDQSPLRDVTSQISNLLTYTNNPLSAAQADALVTVMWENMRDSSGNISTKSANTVAMRKHAQEILRSDQYPVFAEWMDRLDKEKSSVAQNAGPK